MRPLLPRIALVTTVLATALCCATASGQEPGPAAPAAAEAEAPAPAPTLPPGLPIRVTTSTLGMSGFRPPPRLTVRAPALGMTGWRRAPLTLTTSSLAMSGWRPGPHVITTPSLAMTGWQRDPRRVTTDAIAMTGWAPAPAECTPPLIRTNGGCGCPADLLPADGQCIAAAAAPPFDLRVENGAPQDCAAGTSCRFNLLVVNVGDGPYRGPLVVRHDVEPPVARLAAAGRGWTCSAGGCIRPDVTLAAGGNTTLTVDIRLPDGFAGRPRIRHCAGLAAPEPGNEPVRFVQLMLPVAGIDAGPADNQMGQRTRGAIAAFRTEAGLAGPPEIDRPLIAALQRLAPDDPNPANDRACAEVPVAPPPT